MRNKQAVRRYMLRAGAAFTAAALMAWNGVAAAHQAWPQRAVRVIVPYAAGQGADVLMRLVAAELQASLGQSVVVENRAGAAGNIGTASAAKAAPDGYTFLLGTNATHAANAFLYDSPGFDAGKDFAAVALIGLLPMVISTSSAQLAGKGVAEVIASARARPDTLEVGLPSTTAHVVFSQFVKTAHAPLFGVKYKSSGQSMTDAIGGRIPLVIDTVIATRPQLAGGKLHALGITSLKASDMLPGVLPVSEQGVPGFDIVAWNALFAPAGTPQEVIDSLGAHLSRALQQPDMQRRMMDIGVQPLFMGPAEASAFVANERVKWGEIIRSANIRVD